MTNKTTNTPPFKVKCIIAPSSGTLTEGKEYEVVNVEYLVDENYCQVSNNNGDLNWYFASRFQIVETPTKQEFSVGDKVVVNKVSDDFVSDADGNVKVGDIATVTIIGGCGNYDVRLSNPNWEHSWWFSKTDISLADKSSDDNLLTHQEVIQAVIDGKELEIQYTDGTWHSFSTHSTTLYQLINLNFRLKPSLEDKRKAVIKKLLENKVAVLCKCWDDDDSNSAIVAVTSIDDDFVHPYLTDNSAYKNAYIIDDNGNEITDV